MLLTIMMAGGSAAIVTLRRHPKAVGQLVGFTILSTLCYYTFFAALTPFAVTSRHAAPRDVFLALSAGTVVFIALQYPFGALSDRFGRKPQMLVWSAAFAILIMPLSHLVGPGPANLMVVRGIGIGAWYSLTVAL
jgi:MHS family alpha-ketoglutarate permease-like MFS transporter